MTTARDVSTTFESEVAAHCPCPPSCDSTAPPELWCDNRKRATALARAVADRVRREARVCTDCEGKPMSWPKGVGRAMCPTCSGTGIAWGEA